VQMGNLAEGQLGLILDPHRNGGLLPMLVNDPGKRNRFQDMLFAATATLAAMRSSAVPTSIESTRDDGHSQDTNPSSMQAALNALDSAASLRWLHGSLAVALRQAVHVSGRRPTAPACVAILEELIKALPAVDSDGTLDQNVRTAAARLDIIADTLPRSEHG
ncbi:aromatic amino acid lyase, partial [Streptomyces sp. NPDC059083]|uniref:aromatic amino acid lyase n=1 Tax=Streptomyces sp. NPDC059083 TaxID=3346721 RepID=UPI0036870DAB